MIDAVASSVTAPGPEHAISVIHSISMNYHIIQCKRRVYIKLKSVQEKKIKDIATG